MKLNRNGEMPLHLQIKSLVKKRIVAGELKIGQSVPSERDLAEELNVSRMTVRQALVGLREEGLIYQKRGTGTFVSPHKLDIHTRNLNGFFDEMSSRGMIPSSQVLEMNRETAQKNVAEKLQLKDLDEVFSLTRLRLADNIPMSLETTSLPLSKFADLDKFDFATNSLYQVLANNYGVKMVSAEEVLEAALSDLKTSELLAVKKNSPVLIVHRTVFGDDNQPIEYAKSIYRADRYRATFLLVKK